jgi:hypothetical protein
MAKKKTPPLTRLLETPLSLKNLSFFVVLALALVGYNFYIFASPLGSTPEPPAKNLSQSDLMNVLGETISLGEKTEESQQELRKDPTAAYWYAILDEKPNYRDAYIMLSALAYNKHLCTLAQSYLSNALTIDPLAPIDTNTKEQIIACGK